MRTKDFHNLRCTKRPTFSSVKNVKCIQVDKIYTLINKTDGRVNHDLWNIIQVFFLIKLVFWWLYVFLFKTWIKLSFKDSCNQWMDIFLIELIWFKTYFNGHNDSILSTFTVMKHRHWYEHRNTLNSYNYICMTYITYYIIDIIVIW